MTVLPFGTGICMTGPVSKEKYIRNLIYCSCSFGNNWTSRIFCGPNSIGTLPLFFNIVNPGSPFEQTMVSPRTRCYISSFKVFGLAVLERRKNFYHIWAWWPAWSCDTDSTNKFHSPIPLKLQVKFGFNPPCGFREEDA